MGGIPLLSELCVPRGLPSFFISPHPNPLPQGERGKYEKPYVKKNSGLLRHYIPSQ